MISTIPSDNINDFLDFFARLVGAQTASRREGAKPEDINLFRELAHFPLPPLYLGYLQEFGEKDTVLKLTDDTESNVKVLIERYNEAPDNPDYEIPKNGVVIGAQTFRANDSWSTRTQTEHRNLNPSFPSAGGETSQIPLQNHFATISTAKVSLEHAGSKGHPSSSIKLVTNRSPASLAMLSTSGLNPTGLATNGSNHSNVPTAQCFSSAARTKA